MLADIVCISSQTLRWFYSTDSEGFVIEWRKTKSIVFTTADQNKGNNTKSR